MASSTRKGKARAPAHAMPWETALKEEEPAKSLVSRVASSAHSIAREVISSPSGASLASGLASSSNANGKQYPGSLTISSNAVGEPSTWAQRSIQNEQSNTNTITKNGPESFRSNVNAPDTKSAEGISLQAEEYGMSIKPLPHYQNGLTAKAPIRPPIGKAWRQQELEDGSEVVNMVTSRYCNSREKLDLAAMDKFEDISAESLFGPANLSGEQRETRAAMDTILPAPPTYLTENRIHGEHLLPSPEERQAYAKSLLEQWDGFMQHYTDLVWGSDELIAEVDEAKKLIEQIKAGEDEGDDGKALRRLGLVLSHIKNKEAEPR